MIIMHHWLHVLLSSGFRECVSIGYQVGLGSLIYRAQLRRVHGLQQDQNNEKKSIRNGVEKKNIDGRSKNGNAGRLLDRHLLKVYIFQNTSYLRFRTLIHEKNWWAHLRTRKIAPRMGDTSDTI